MVNKIILRMIRRIHQLMSELTKKRINLCICRKKPIFARLCQISENKIKFTIYEDHQRYFL